MERKGQKAGGPLTVAVGGARNEQGKTTVAVNLAAAFADAGQRAVVVDADFVHPAVHEHLGLRPTATLTDFVLEHVDTLCPKALRAPRLSAVSCADAPPRWAAQPQLHAPEPFCSERRVLPVLRELQSWDVDVIVMDCGALEVPLSQQLFITGDMRLVVSSADLTALQASYAFLRGAVHGALRQLAMNPHERDLLEEAFVSRSAADELRGDSSTSRTASGGIEDEDEASEPGVAGPQRLSQVMAYLSRHDPAFSRDIAQALDSFAAGLVANLLPNTHHMSAVAALSRMVQTFLGVSAPVVGGLLRSQRVAASTAARSPFIPDLRQSPEGRALGDVVQRCLQTDLQALRSMRRRERILSGADLRTTWRPRAPGAPSGLYQAALPGPVGAFLRRHERLPVRQTATLECLLGTLTVTITDVSLGGASVLAGEVVPEQSRARLLVPLEDGEVTLEATVRHQAGGRLGLEFVGDPVPKAVLDLVHWAMDRGRLRRPSRRPPARVAGR